METVKKPGRPPKLGTALTQAQRAAQYRQRRHEAGSVAHENIATASDAALLAGLVRQVKAIAAQDPDIADTARFIAGHLMAELCDRHKIQIPTLRA